MKNYLRCQKLYLYCMDYQAGCLQASQILVNCHAILETASAAAQVICTCTMSSLLPPLLRIDRTRYYTHTDMIDLEPPSRL